VLSYERTTRRFLQLIVNFHLFLETEARFCFGLPRPAAHLCDLADAARRPDVGGCRLPWNEPGDGLSQKRSGSLRV